jgi:hypothetical protein
MTILANLLSFIGIVLTAWLFSLAIGLIRIVLWGHSALAAGRTFRNYVGALLPVQVLVKLPGAIGATAIALWWHPDSAMMMVLITMLTLNVLADDEYSLGKKETP